MKRIIYLVLVSLVLASGMPVQAAGSSKNTRHVGRKAGTHHGKHYKQHQVKRQLRKHARRT
jgi:hypothetical protein